MEKQQSQVSEENKRDDQVKTIPKEEQTKERKTKSQVTAPDLDKENAITQDKLIAKLEAELAAKKKAAQIKYLQDQLAAFEVNYEDNKDIVQNAQGIVNEPEIYMTDRIKAQAKSDGRYDKATGKYNWKEVR